jgi:hypothetical protein
MKKPAPLADESGGRAQFRIFTMNSTTISADGQASLIRYARLGKDRSELIVFCDGSRIQLSASQIAILRAVYDRSEMRPRDLHAILDARLGPAVIREPGPVNASQRASLSRTLRRLNEQCLIYRTARGTVVCTAVGAELARFFAQREAIRQNVNRVAITHTLLTFPTEPGIALGDQPGNSPVGGAVEGEAA